jgi:hypothetical protein
MLRRRPLCTLLVPLVALLLSAGLAAPRPLAAQGNYEIQVYGSDTVAPGATMVELHSNYTPSGPLDAAAGVRPDDQAWHETVEITHGVTPWFETGFYVFTSASSPDGWQWVGDHIRPRVRVPESWGWPVGVSLSLEVGYQRRAYSEDTWTLEIRPIVDKKLGRWYLSLNPTLERSLHGPGTAEGLVFSPNVKAGYDLTRRVNAGLEYYGSVGPVTGFDPFERQQHMLGPALDLDVGPEWEVNAGALVGLSRSTDRLIVKLILGRRFSPGHGSR